MLSQEEDICHIPLPQVAMPMPVIMSSFHSPSYLSPVGAECMDTEAGQPSNRKKSKRSCHIPLAQVKTTLPFLLSSYHSPLYLFPVGQNA